MSFTFLKQKLDYHYLQYKRKFSSKDPVWFLHRFNDKEDIEITGFIASFFAYGSVEQINRFINNILNKIGNKPYEFTINFSKHKDKKYLKDLNYRFHSNYDIVNLFKVLNTLYNRYNSINNLFIQNYGNSDSDIIPALSKFSETFNKLTANNSLKIPTPENNSVCKRLNLFLRWMVRKDEIDLGIWNNISPSKLIIPVDVHISRIARRLQLVKRITVDLKFARELTNRLKQFDENDPVKYDFSLCHLGIENKNF